MERNAGVVDEDIELIEIVGEELQRSADETLRLSWTRSG